MFMNKLHITYKILFLPLLIAALLCFAGCNSKKQVTPGQNYMAKESADVRFDNITHGYKPWSSFVASGKISISMGKKLSSGVQFRMIRGKSIAISVRPFLGIEMMRVYIDNDSAFLIDKTHKAVVAIGLKQFTSDIPLTIDDLQDMFINRAFIIGKGTLDAEMKKDVNFLLNSGDDNFTISPKKRLKGFDYGFTYNVNNELQQLLITIDSGSFAPWEVTYNDIIGTEGGNIARSTEISTELGGKPVSMALNYDVSKVKWNTEKNDSPGLRQDYRRVSVKEFMKLW